MNSASRSGGRRLRLIVGVALSVAVVVAVWTEALVTERYLSDSGLIPFGTGASLVNRWRALLAVVITVGAMVIVAFAALFLRRRISAGGKLGAAGFAIVFSVAALVTYPHAANARLVVLDPTTGRDDWSIDARAEWIAGVESQTGSHIVLGGTDSADHNCEGFRFVSVTIDLARHEVVTVRTQPRTFRPGDPLPPRPIRPDPQRFRIEQGTPVRRCSS